MPKFVIEYEEDGNKKTAYINADSRYDAKRRFRAHPLIGNCTNVKITHEAAEKQAPQPAAKG